MKQLKPFYLLVLLTFGLVYGQDYQPFREGVQYKYTFGQNELYFLEVDSSGTMGTDSVFFFNRSVIALIHDYPFGGEENIFLGQMLKKPGGLYEFVSDSGEVISLQTQGSSPWTFHQNSGTQAIISNRSLETFDGQQDSVITISTGTAPNYNGPEIRISKNHGLIGGFNFRQFLAGYSTITTYEVFKIPGPAYSSWDFFDFEPNDFFLTRIDFTEGNIVSGDREGECQRWTEQKVLQRDTSANGDTLIFLMEEDAAGECSQSFIGTQPAFMDIPFPRQNIIRKSPSKNDINFGAPTGSRLPHPYGHPQLIIPGPGKYNPQTGRVSLPLWECSDDSLAGITRPYPLMDETVYTTGLGKTRQVDLDQFITSHWISSFTTELECYHKATDSLLPCTPLESLVGVEENLILAAPVVYPNPAQDLIHLDFGNQNLPLPLGWQIFDLQGRELRNGVLEQQSAAISVEELPEGILLLQIEGVAKPVKVLHRK